MKGVYLDDAQEPRAAAFPAFYPVAGHRVPLGSASQQSKAFQSGTRLVLVTSTSECFIKIGENPVATTSDLFIVRGVAYYFGVQASQKIAAIQESNPGGTLSIIEAL